MSYQNHDTVTLRKMVAEQAKEAGLVPGHIGVWQARKEECVRIMEAIGKGKHPAEAIKAVLSSRPGSEKRRDPKPATGGSLDAVIAGIARQAATEALEQAKDSILDADTVARIAREAVSGIAPVRVELAGSGEVKDLGRQHERFPVLLRWLAIGRPVLLHGPAGSGKTTACRKAGESLGLTPLVLHLGPQTTQSSIFGYFSAAGEYVETPFRRAYEGTGEFEGGAIIVLDELDRCNPRVAVTLNGGLENGHMSFPDREVARAEKTIIVACGNTVLGGADRQYVAAQQQDGAFADRFVFLEWDYDFGFERDLALAHAGDDGSLRQRIGEWVDTVQRARIAARMLKSRALITPRASITGARALAAGMSVKEIERPLLWKGLPRDDVKKIRKMMPDVDLAMEGGAR